MAGHGSRPAWRLVVAGVLVMVSGSGSWEQTWLALLASVAVLGGVALVLLPWGLKFWRDLEAERAGRVRATERAEIAAHLHDSVLQTLALIQRRAANEHDVVRLARAQERELRGWLYRDPARTPASCPTGSRPPPPRWRMPWGTPWKWSAVGDCAMTERHEALVQAAREAMLNAARHGGGAVSVYLEVTDGRRRGLRQGPGPGLRPGCGPADRLGVRESIIGRMQPPRRDRRHHQQPRTAPRCGSAAVRLPARRAGTRRPRQRRGRTMNKPPAPGRPRTVRPRGDRR